MRRKGFVLLISIIMALLGYLAGCAAFLWYFPNEIRLTEGGTHQLALGTQRLPFNITLQNETASVLKINDTPLTIQTQSQGTAEMRINAFGMPVKRVVLDVVPDLEVVPCGMTIDVRINTNGVMVLGTGSVKGQDGLVYKPSEGKLKPGDLVLAVNGMELKNKEEFIAAVSSHAGEMSLRVRRDGADMDILISPAVSAKDKSHKLGVWVRDSTKGIGTITYYNPETGVFGALGHGIMDVDTKRLMSVKDGVIRTSKVTAVKKGVRGTPGELEGAVEREQILGKIMYNSPCGIYGLLDQAAAGVLPTAKMKVANQHQIHEGPASIRTNVASNSIKEYDIFIENVNRYATDETKGMVIRITDPELLKLTNGIVQGMSGSPIIQDGLLIGAVTHVFVQDPTKGYGIFIENMLKQENSTEYFS